MHHIYWQILDRLLWFKGCCIKYFRISVDVCLSHTHRLGRGRAMVAITPPLIAQERKKVWRLGLKKMHTLFLYIKLTYVCHDNILIFILIWRTNVRSSSFQKRKLYVLVIYQPYEKLIDFSKVRKAFYNFIFWPHFSFFFCLFLINNELNKKYI